MLLAPRSLDFQVRCGHPAPPAGEARAAGCVVVLTRCADGEIDDLSLRLAASGVPLLRIDSDRCATGAALTWSPTDDIVRTEASTFRPLLVWRRYFAPESIDAGDSPLACALARSLWVAFAAGLSAHIARAPGAELVNRGAGHTGIDRVTQLECARAVGLPTPCSVVTTIPASACELLPGTGDVIVKSLAEHVIEPQAGSIVGVSPRRMSRVELARESGSEPAPLLIQDYVAARRELRAYVVGSRVIAYEVVKASPSALRSLPDQVQVTPVALEPALERRLLAMTAKLEVEIGAFDLLEARDGIVFLELNTVCAWRWSDRLAGAPRVSHAVAEAIVERFRALAERAA